MRGKGPNTQITIYHAIESFICNMDGKKSTNTDYNSESTLCKALNTHIEKNYYDTNLMTHQ